MNCPKCDISMRLINEYAASYYECTGLCKYKDTPDTRSIRLWIKASGDKITECFIPMFDYAMIRIFLYKEKYNISLGDINDIIFYDEDVEGMTIHNMKEVVANTISKYRKIMLLL